MKKRNRVLEVILCATLAVVVFWGYMLAARDNGVFALEDIEGDRTALNAFDFEGLAGDDNGQIYYTWQNGELKTKYYAATDDEMRYIIRQERDGSKGISRYFKKRSLERSDYFSDTEFAPSKDANVRRLSNLEDLSESTREYLGEYFDGKCTVQGVTADALDVYGKVKNYTGGETRFFTGLQLKGGEYQAAKVKQGDTTHLSSWFDGRNEVILCTVKMDDAWYTIPRTGADGQGEVSIFRIPKDGMEDFPYSDEDALYSTKQYGKAEPLQTFSVNAENRILSLEKAGDNQLLLARTEQDALVLELYDTKGKLLDRLETGIQKVSEYDMNDNSILKRADGLVLCLNLGKTFWDENDTYYREMEAVKYFVVQEKAIQEIAIDDSAEYVDVQDGKVLRLEGTWPDNLAAEYFGSMMDGYDITVTDAKTGDLLYHGKLKTDFSEDDDRKLFAVNIGQREKPLEERQDKVNWDMYNSIGMKERNFETVLPVDGKVTRPSWKVGEEGAAYEWDTYY